MSLTVLLIAGLPALLVSLLLSLAILDLVSIYLLWQLSRLASFSGSAEFCRFRHVMRHIALFAGMGQQNQRQERRRQWNSSSEQQVTLHQTLSARSGGQSPTSSSVASGATATGDHNSTKNAKGHLARHPRSRRSNWKRSLMTGSHTRIRRIDYASSHSAMTA